MTTLAIETWLASPPAIAAELTDRDIVGHMLKVVVTNTQTNACAEFTFTPVEIPKTPWYYVRVVQGVMRHSKLETVEGTVWSVGMLRYDIANLRANDATQAPQMEVESATFVDVFRLKPRRRKRYDFQ